MRRIQCDPVNNNIPGAASDIDASTTYIIMVRSTQLNYRVLIYNCHEYAPHSA